MSRLVSVTAYARDATQFASASPMLLGASNIVRVTNATPKVKQSYPAASGNINTVIVTNEASENSHLEHVYLVSESQATIATNAG